MDEIQLTNNSPNPCNECSETVKVKTNEKDVHLDAIQRCECNSLDQVGLSGILSTIKLRHRRCSATVNQIAHYSVLPHYLYIICKKPIISQSSPVITTLEYAPCTDRQPTFARTTANPQRERTDSPLVFW